MTIVAFARTRLTPCLLLVPLAAGAAARPADIPIEAFFRPPLIRQVTLNPAGTHVAMLVHDPGPDTTGLLIQGLADGKTTGVKGDKTFDLSSYTWAGNDRLVFSVARDNLYAWGLYAVARDDTRKVTTLNTRDAVQVLGSPRARPDRLLVWIRRSARDEGRPAGIVEVDLRRDSRAFGQESDANVRASISDPPGVDGVRSWLRDRQGEVRYAIVHRDGELGLRRRDGDAWTPVAISLDRDQPMAVDRDPKVLLVAHLNAEGRRELRRFDTGDGSLGPVLHTDDKYDFGGGSIRLSPGDDEIVGLAYSRQAPFQVWFREEENELQRALDAVLPTGRVNRITSRSLDGNRMVVLSGSDRHPGSLYLFDRADRRLSQLADLAPWLDPRLLGPVRLLTFKARDGLQLDAYVTLPLDHDPSKPAPLIVLPHGGPWVRDAWGYDPTSQFFASRGYVVFRPNYRGSSGYRAEISIAPRHEFRRMHDDVTDGVHALVAAGIADPKRLAIIGGSFGGYLAVAGAAFEPGLYRCAITINGVFDWERVLREDRANNPDSFRPDWIRRGLGDPKANREKFESLSPIHAVDRIQCPVFVAHGTEDTNADTSQSRRLVRALEKRGVAHEAFFIKEEGHGIGALRNRVELYSRIEAFLRRNL